MIYCFPFMKYSAVFMCLFFVFHYIILMITVGGILYIFYAFILTQYMPWMGLSSHPFIMIPWYSSFAFYFTCFTRCVFLLFHHSCSVDAFLFVIAVWTGTCRLSISSFQDQWNRGDVINLLLFRTDRTLYLYYMVLLPLFYYS